MLMMWLLAAAMALCGALGGAIAAWADDNDRSRRRIARATPAAAPPPAFTWTGFYFGVNAGYGWAARTGKYASALTVDPRRCKPPPAAPAGPGEPAAPAGPGGGGGDEAPE